MSFLPQITQAEMPSSPSPWQKLTLSNFSGGLATSFPEEALRDDQFTSLVNWYIEKDGTLKARGPFRPLDVASSKESVIPDSAAPLSFFWTELSGSNILLASWDNGANYEVSYWDDSNDRWAGEGAGTTIKSDLTDGYTVKFVQFSVNDAEDIIFCNGKNTPQRWLGSAGASTDLGLAVPAFEGSEAATESDTLSSADLGITVSGVYYYKFTYFYDDSGTSTKYGESGPSAILTSADLSNASASNPVACSLDLDLDGSALPSGVSKCRVYRSPADTIEGPFRYVGEFTSGDTYTDQGPNTEEGVEVASDAGTPPKLKNPLAFRGRLWGIGINASGSLTNKGVWSNADAPDMFPAANYAYFPDPLAGPKAFGNDLYWFTEKEIYKTPNGDVLTYPTPVKVASIGCDSYDSIVDVGNGLVWQYDGTFYWTDFNTYNEDEGDYPFPIGEPIKDKVDTIGTLYKTNTVACRYHDKYIVSFSANGEATNNTTLVWDSVVGKAILRRGEFGTWSELDYDANWLQTYDGTLYHADPSHKYIMEHDFAGTADYHTKTEYDASTSYNLATDLRTKLLHFGDDWAEKIIKSITILGASSGATFQATIQLNDNTYTQTAALTFGTGSATSSSSDLIWDVGTWNNYKWASEVKPTFQSTHVKFPSQTKGRTAKLVLTSLDSEDTKLGMLALYYKTLPAVT